MTQTPQGAEAVPGGKAARRRGAGRLRAALSVAVLAGSIALLVVSGRREHQVCGEDAEELAELLGFVPFELISERQLVVDATFTGVVRRGERLYSTYDRSQPRQKQACPT